MLKWLRDNALGTMLLTRRSGARAGEDELGNVYYRQRRGADWRSERRWVLYASRGEIEASMVPAGWNAWLHHNREKTPSEEPLVERRWEKPHQPNLSGTLAGLCPARPRAAGRPSGPGDGGLRGLAPLIRAVSGGSGSPQIRGVASSRLFPAGSRK